MTNSLCFTCKVYDSNSRLSGLFANAINVVGISGNTFDDSQTDFFPLPQKLEITLQPVKACTTGRDLGLFGLVIEWAGI